jgi:hypothetical protein
MMPSTSKKQHNFMAAIAHNPAFAKKVGIPQSVGKDFNEADKGKKFGSGGYARPDLQKINKPKTLHGKMSIMKEGGDTMATKKMNMGGYAGGGAAKSDMKEDMKMDLKQDKSMMQKAVNKHEGRLHKGQPMTKLAKGGVAPSKMGSVKTNRTPDGVASKGRTKGKIIKMNMGGKPC